MRRLAYGLYALSSYTIGMASLLYLCGFMLNLIVPKGIDGGTIGQLNQSLAINVAILAAFLVPHSIMARPRFKKWWTTIIPAPLERATYIFFSGITLLVALWLWQPIPIVLWSLGAGLPTYVAFGIYAFGWAMIVISTFTIDHFTFFGLRQVWESFVGAVSKQGRLSQSWFYALVRHPISLGWMLVFLSTPVMTAGHLLFAAGMIIYILVVTPIEERDIEAGLGEDYRAYRRRVRAFLP
ncbi:MAG: isoprenylcysteine carboxylmethyltransferase family protein, partial [Oricola sp.]